MVGFLKETQDDILCYGQIRVVLLHGVETNICPLPYNAIEAIDTMAEKAYR